MQVGHVSGVADQARRILTSMARREVKIKVSGQRCSVPVRSCVSLFLLCSVCHQIMMACFILLIIGVIAIVIYYMSNKSK